MSEERTWRPGDGPVLPDADESDYPPGAVPLPVEFESPCCDSHNEHCEPPSELCCEACTEVAHDSFPVRHGDGSKCVLDTPPYKIEPAVSRTSAAPVTFYEPDEPVEKVVAAFERGEKSTTQRPDTTPEAPTPCRVCGRSDGLHRWWCSAGSPRTDTTPEAS